MILCLCQRGNVRSATLAAILRDVYGLQDVIATGVDTTSADVLINLAYHSDKIFVIGDTSLIERLPPQITNAVHIDIGPDRWQHPMHPDLIKTIFVALESIGVSRPANADWYIGANTTIIARVYGELS
jgi:hypothetical protein